jgi:hypothetical protein
VREAEGGLLVRVPIDQRDAIDTVVVLETRY